MANPETIERAQAAFDLANDAHAWLELKKNPGGPFGSAGHAFDVIASTIREQERAVKAECKRLGLRYDERAFWSLHLEFILATARERGKATAEHRKRVYGTVAAENLEYVDLQVRSGRFQSPSHFFESGIRYFMQLEVAGILQPIWTLAPRWKEYEKAAKA